MRAAFVLHQDVAIGRIARPKGVKRLPVVLTRDEVRRLLARLEGTPRLVALLLYGSGLWMLEALQLQVKAGGAESGGWVVTLAGSVVIRE